MSGGLLPVSVVRDAVARVTNAIDAIEAGDYNYAFTLLDDLCVDLGVEIERASSSEEADVFVAFLFPPDNDTERAA